MNRLSRWQHQVQQWHDIGKHDQADELVDLINNPPKDIWGPELSVEQSQGLGCWLDACTRLHEHYLEQEQFDQAYQVLCLAQGRLEQMISSPYVDINIRFSCSQKLEQIVMVIVEFCKQRSESHWKKETSNQLEAYIKFSTRYPFTDAPIPILKGAKE